MIKLTLSLLMASSLGYNHYSTLDSTFLIDKMPPFGVLHPWDSCSTSTVASSLLPKGIPVTTSLFRLVQEVQNSKWRHSKN